jgi:hypothetical protein
MKATLWRFLLGKRNFSERICRQNQESYIMFKYFFIENCIVYEIMWKRLVDRDTEHMII